MNYDDIAAHFLYGAESIAEPAVPGSYARRLRDAIEPIATIGWWSRSAADNATTLGLDFFGGYVWGRAAALGADAAPEVVVSAFGVFEPQFLMSVLAAARSGATHSAVLSARELGATDGLKQATVGIDPEIVREVGDRLHEALRGLDATARPLFSGLRALPTPLDPYGKLWRSAELVREHRGDGHLGACISLGLDAVQMNVLTELWLNYPVGEYSSTRGYSPDRLSQAVIELQKRGWVNDEKLLTSAGRDARIQIEDLTDASQSALISALGTNLEDVVASARIIGASVIGAHAAPADPRKRAAG
jgi:hypothetical protein